MIGKGNINSSNFLLPIQMATNRDVMVRRSSTRKRSILLFGGLAIVLVSLLTLAFNQLVVPSDPAIDSRSIKYSTLAKDFRLEDLLEKSQTQDGESPQLMDATSYVVDGPIERQAQETGSKVIGIVEEEATHDQKPTELAVKHDTNPEEAQENYDGSLGPRFEEARRVKDYDDLVFCTLTPNLNSTVNLALLRALVGSIHQLREGRHKIPRIEIFTTSFLSQIPDSITEEISWWSNVHVRNVQNYLGLPLSAKVLTADEHHIRLALLASLVKEHGHAVWIKFGYVVEPQRIPIYRAEKQGSATKLTNAYKAGRDKMVTLAHGMSEEGFVIAKQGDHLIFSNQLPMRPRQNSTEQAELQNLYSSGDLIIEGYNREKGLALIKKQLECISRPSVKGRCGPDILKKSEHPKETAAELGVYPMDPSSQAACLIDIREEGILNTILMTELAATPLTEAYKKLQKQSDAVRKVALALPTTSKGLEEGEKPVFLRQLVPSFIRTVTEEEFRSHLFTIYIGIDHDDPLLDTEAALSAIIRDLIDLIGDRPIQVKVLQLPNAKRVALLWNLLYLHALREGAEFFYQVNDDLTMKTSGWLTYFTSTLDNNKGFGVIGPADHHNGLNCTILTQAMVTSVHFDIFGMLYPIELKDWKSDRWLTYVYQPDDTHCRQDVVADNGGAPTRYKHCEFLSYIIYLEAGKRRIAEWKAAHAATTPP